MIRLRLTALKKTIKIKIEINLFENLMIKIQLPGDSNLRSLGH